MRECDARLCSLSEELGVFLAILSFWKTFLALLREFGEGGSFERTTFCLWKNTNIVRSLTSTQGLKCNHVLSAYTGISF